MKYKNVGVKGFSWFIFMILALSAISGCFYFDVDYPIGDSSPIANYRITGNVSDENGNPIDNIRIVIGELYRNTQTNSAILYRPDTLYSDASGFYMFSRDSVYVNGFRIIAKDIDGSANGGEFENDTVDVSNFQYIKDSNSSNIWYKGMAITENKNITLKIKISDGNE
ncbi:MAG: radical SAM-associated putative lipoprotein [Bacteroidales bacterium]|nr:radical SAM-associated putative lipoprotein [Bacteroidales bacterium]MDD4670169.1 radical SAM-associated putative lipoprotein [Bacteroidales bacterium]